MLRVASGVILSAGFIVFLFSSDANWFFLMMGLCAFVCIIELGSMMKVGKFPFSTYTCAILACIMLLAIYYGEESYGIAMAGLSVAIVWIIAVLFSEHDAAPMAINTLFGLFYITFPLAALALIRSLEEGQWMVLIIVTANAFSDSFAYYTGRIFGKHKLAPKISPGKTVEGFAGGVVGAFFGSISVSYIFVPELNILHAIAAGGIAGVAGPMGDLAESATKRKMGVKDSGKIIPGHGGVLDRIDSLMFTAVFFYAYLVLVVL
ncbi:MAG TPA: phosphatidate cytidylyltransferase [Nitrospinota bacterium]|nr:phosphatidate cytidylyltransferase [Nitrospinota bacterium]